MPPPIEPAISPVIRKAILNPCLPGLLPSLCNTANNATGAPRFKRFNTKSQTNSAATVCPANCIKLVPGEDEQGNRYPLVFEIDEFRCIFCGYCQEVCPEEAIHVGVHYENAEYSREGFVYDLERLTAQTHPVSELWDPAYPTGE